MKTLTASDRSTLTRLAASLPKGDETRRAILAGLKKAGELPEALKENVENPPEAVQKLKEEMKAKKASRKA